MPKGSDFKTRLAVSIANLGKVPKGDVGLGGFTLLCGPNNTGKTYVSKVLYSVLRAVNSNHAWNLVGHEVETLHRLLPSGSGKSSGLLRREIAELAAMPSHFLVQYGYAERVRAMAEQPGFRVADLRSGSAQRARNGRGAAGKTAWAAKCAEIERSIKAIKRFAKMPEENVLQKSLESALPALLLGSFMTPRMAALATGSQTGFSFDIKGVLGFSTAGNKCRIACRDLAEISAMPLVLYLDGTEIRVNGSLANTFSSPRSQRGVAEDCPCYHSDFLRMLERPRSTSANLRDLQERIAEIIGGKLEYRGGMLHFKDREGGRMNASLASAGVRQLGMLGLLIDRGLLRENAMVFIDEPEANLHPEWQAALGEILTSLALRGINVVLATHSPYIIQHVKYRVRNDAFNEMLAVNHFSSSKRINGEVKAFDSNYDKLRYVQKMLNETYMKTLLRGMAGV